MCKIFRQDFCIGSLNNMIQYGNLAFLKIVGFSDDFPRGNGVKMGADLSN
jgi:hypothetical protein